MPSRKSLGQVMLYGSCIALAAVMMGYYWLGYIPSQREYFATLRFHTLASIGDQLRGKLANLASAFVYAVKYAKQPDGYHPPADYLATLVPELKYQKGPTTKGALPDITLETLDDGIRFRFGEEHVADASLRGMLSRLGADELFDDVLVAEGEKGRVLYQRTSSSPTVLSLAELLKPAAGQTAVPDGNGKDAGAVRTAIWSGTEYTLLIQPVTVWAQGKSTVTLTLCGMVRSQRLAQEARHAPPEYVLAVFVPLLILVLAGPFLKIALLTRTARLAFHDVALLAVCALFSGAVLAVLTVSWRPHPLGNRDPDPELSAFADRLNDGIVSDLERMNHALVKLDDTLPGEDEIDNRTSLLESNPDAQHAYKDGAPFEFIFWTNEKGCQVAKWTVNSLNTGLTDQSAEVHFRNVLAGRLWSFPQASYRPFTVVPQMSPTTSQIVVVMAMPSEHWPAGPRQIEAETCLPRPDSPVVSISMVGSLPSLSSPPVPQDVGFAVIDLDGRVLFHSSSDRDLHENLFQETTPSQKLRAAVAMRSKCAFSTYYRGRPYWMTVRPVTGITGIPWSIAVFRQREPQQAVTGMIWGDTLILFTAFICLAVLLPFLISIVARLAGVPVHRQVDWILSRVWADPERTPAFRKLMRDLLALTVAFLALQIAGAAYSYRSSAWLLPAGLLAPLLAIAVTTWRLWKPASGSGQSEAAPQTLPIYAANMTLCLLLIGVIPAASLLTVSSAFESRADTAHWQQNLVRAITARRTRIEARLELNPGLTDESKNFIHGLPPGPYEDFYLGVFNTKIAAGESVPATPQEAKLTRWQTLLLAIRPAVPQEAIESQAMLGDLEAQGPCRTTLLPSGRQGLSCPGSPVRIESALPGTESSRNPIWWVVTLGLLAGAFGWNCIAFRKLYSVEFCQSPLPLLSDIDWRSTAAECRHLLVLGLPLSGKDRAVVDWLGFTAPRVNLYEARVSPAWVEETLVRVRAELEAPVAIAAGVGASGGRTLPATHPPYVHISNLETKLADPADRQAVLDLIGRLLVLLVGDRRVGVIVTSAVDPVFHFESVRFEDGSKLEQPLPEPDLQRLARLLHNFRKVGLPGPPQPSKPLPAAIREECSHHKELLRIGAEVAAQAQHLERKPDEEMWLAMIAERARALYKLFWATCTRPEKLLLIQLAQTGFANPNCFGTLEELIRKGLVTQDVRPRIMNETFRRFLTKVEERKTVRAWESEAGQGSWAPIRNILLASLALSLIVIALTQADTLQTATTVIGGVVTAMAGVTRLLGYFTGGNSRTSTAPTSA
jgi:hypothetical protein